MRFDKVVLINLKRREDRLEDAIDELSKTDWDYEVFEAYDGKNMEIPSWYKASRGAFGCLQSHLAVYKQLAKKSFNSCLILEDDFVIKNDVKETLGIIADVPFPDDWRMIYLGGQPLARLKDYIPGLSRCSQVDRTHAYAVNEKFIRDVYPRIEEQHGFHIDSKLRALQSEKTTFIFNPSVIGQRPSYSDVNGERAYVSRFWTVHN